MSNCVLSAVVPAVLSAALAAQCQLVKDINPKGLPLSSNPTSARVGQGGTDADDFVKCGSSWYFTATTTSAGWELWKTDGTAAGTVMVADVRQGSSGSNIAYLACCNGKVFFSANDGTHGAELWTSDGTAAGTVLLKDIRPGPAWSNPRSPVCVGNKLYFSAVDDSNGRELWCSDGTPAGTVLVKDIRGGSSGSNPRFLRVDPAGKAFYFQADDGVHGTELWKSDGTAAGTVMVKDINTGSRSSSPIYLVNLGSITLFRAVDATAGGELWKTDGTAAGTVRVKDIVPGGLGSAPVLRYSSRSLLGRSLFFTANDGKTGYELWKTDGTPAGTVLVKDIRPGGRTSSSFPRYFRANGSTVYFQADDGTRGAELWKSDGTSSGTVMVHEIHTGRGGSAPQFLTNLGSKVVFSAVSRGVGGSFRGLWISDGTAAGTREILAISPRSSLPTGFTVLSATRVMFAAGDANTYTGNGRELWETDGTRAGTREIKDIHVGKASSSPVGLSCSDGKTLYYAADDGTNGTELWKTDASGTTMVKDIQPGSGDSKPAGFTSCWNGTKLVTVFGASGSGQGRELWTTDGTTAGTVLVKDIRPGPSGSDPRDFTCCGGRIFFKAKNSELWVTDGTAAGTVELREFIVGSPSELTCFHGNLYFVGRFGHQPGETGLWWSDGTTAGTSLVKAGQVSGLTYCHGALYFSFGGGLWRSDGTPAGTHVVSTARGGVDSITCIGERFVFFRKPTNKVAELCVSDGTAAGTRLVKAFTSARSSSYRRNLTRCGDVLFFTADDGATGIELWKTDLTPAGTVLVKDIHRGPDSSSPTDLLCAGKGIYFRATTRSSATSADHELYFSDGTANGTTTVCSRIREPSELTICNGTVYVSANNPAVGVELHAIGGRPATVEILGQGCGTAPPSLSATNPVIGTTGTIRGSGAPRAGARLLVIGFPASPFYVPGLALPGCSMWVDLRMPTVLSPLPTGSSWSLSVPIANRPSFVGVTMAMQAAFDPGLVLSNGVQLTMGN